MKRAAKTRGIVIKATADPHNPPPMMTVRLDFMPFDDIYFPI